MGCTRALLTSNQLRAWSLKLATWCLGACIPSPELAMGHNRTLLASSSAWGMASNSAWGARSRSLCLELNMGAQPSSSNVVHHR
ncbi:UNVERIFIED_CONTAM: hypothetical protein Sradi_4921100 [Sesamum radiatum]|uniref:Secreted protein n=1 Tax=Sesamum radiatum TaxID=300843 RepID=A0AAW2MCQ7_SESRA